MAATAAEKLSYATPDQPALQRALIRLVERLSGQRALAAMYERALSRGPLGFFGGALDELGVTVDLDPAALAAVPREGPVVFVANHPFGVIDGLVLCDIAARTRGDFRVLLHQALYREPTLERFMLPIDFAGTREAARRNLAARDEAIATLRAGGTVLIFPAGGISTAREPGGPVTDLEWALLPARLIREGGATVVPVYFEGQNSALFQWASRVNLTLRLSLVIHEVARRRGGRVRVVVGPPIPPEALAPLTNRRALMDHLRACTYALGGPEAEAAAFPPASLAI